MANDYRILDERDIKNFQAGNKLEVTEIGNKVTYEHIGEPPNMLPSQEKVLEYGDSFNITVPSVYDSTGHVKSETKYSFIMPQETDTSNFLTKDNFGDKEGNPVTKSVDGDTVIYSHSTKSLIDSTPDSATQLTYGGTFEIPALSAADGYGHATETTTYKFQMPKAVDVSGYITKDSFGDEKNNPVVKGENDKNQITYSHKTLTPTLDNPATVNLEYDKEFQFIALSATDGYGHANQNTTYKFKMPKASTTTINTSDFLKKTELEATFDAEAPLDVDITNNVVTYSHTGSSPSTATEKEKDLTLGGFFNITVPSAYNGTGHVTTTQPYKFNMPPMPTIRNCIGTEKNNSFYSFSTDIDAKATSLDTDPNLDLTSVCFITFYPNLGYSDTTTSKIVVPGPFTIPVATYLNTMDKVDYPFQALKIKYTTIDTVNVVQTIQIESYTVSITLTVNSQNNKAYFNLIFPKALFSKITVMGF